MRHIKLRGQTRRDTGTMPRRFHPGGQVLFQQGAIKQPGGDGMTYQGQRALAWREPMRFNLPGHLRVGEQINRGRTVHARRHRMARLFARRQLELWEAGKRATRWGDPHRQDIIGCASPGLPIQIG